MYNLRLATVRFEHQALLFLQLYKSVDAKNIPSYIIDTAVRSLTATSADD